MLALLLWAALSTARAQDAIERPPTIADRLERALSRVRASRGDLDVRPARWDTRFTTPDVEQLLSDPAGLADRSAEWREAFAGAKGAAGLSAFAGTLLQLPTEAPRNVAFGDAPGLPPALASAIGDMAAAVARAQPFLSQARASLPAAEQERLSAAFLKQLIHGPAERLEPELFESAARFDRAALFQALRCVAEAADRAVASLKEARLGGLKPPRTIVVDGLTVTLGGAGDDEYAEADVASSLLVDLGGKNFYRAAPAAAGPGEIKIVIDLGAPVIDGGSAATGRFGIGLLYLPSDASKKSLRGGHFSLGAGLFGAGLLSMRGDRARLESGDFSQGAAAFGVGALDVEGKDAVLVSSFSGQGFAFTGGVGLFRLKGRGAKLSCGLRYPDPRDAVAAISLCQGVGYGPRAFAAGGYGLARVESDDAEIESNYFAQGSGYWHGFGGFYFSGDRARIQSRRYGQGAGIHTALGSMEVSGSRNRVLHWGVGPGFGWDWGSGYAAVRGDENKLYADWASGKGDVNGHGFVLVDGRANQLRLVEAGSGILKRGGPSYGVVVVSGTANQVWEPRISSSVPFSAFSLSPYGVIEGEGSARLEKELALEGPQFLNLDAERAAAAKADFEWNSARLSESDRLPAAQRVKRWLFLASEGGLDGRTPTEAMNRLLSLPDAEAALLPGLLSSDRFEEFLFLRIAIAAYGPRLVPAMEQAVASAGGLRKALLLSLFRSAPAEPGVKAALAVWRERDWRVRRESLGTLASLLDREGGEEPGRLAFLEEWLGVCRRKNPAEPLSPETIERIGQKRPGDLLGALALDPASTANERLELLAKVSDPFGPVSAEALNTFASIWGRRPAACKAALERELKSAKTLEPKVRERILEGVQEGSQDILPVALIALGQLGRAKDAHTIASELEHHSALVREAAASALGRLGKGGESEIAAALSSSTAPVRAMAVLAAAGSTDPDVFHLLSRGFDDADEGVRLTAVTAPFAAQVPLTKYRKDFVTALDVVSATDVSPAVRSSASNSANSFR
ncbi:MAG: hypothetical protein HY925_02695 [Elusimicrobia bacterium]|nr:hypothetical protein [Elusimicrobiota bacterium]